MAVVNIYREKKNKPIEASKPTLSRQELESVLDCLIHDRLGSGDITRKLEKSFASTFHYKHVLAVNSLSAGYHLAFLALGVGKDDTVLMSAVSPVAACDAARYVGADVRLIDLDRNSFHPSNENLQALLEKMENETGKLPSVYILDHSFGSVSPVETASLKAKGIRIIEDFTGLVGSDEDGVVFGNTGHIALCGLSEQDIITTGNGAILVTSDPKLQGRLSSMRYGGKRVPELPAYDYRLEDFQSAMGLDQISHLGLILPRRKKIGQKYMETLRLTPHESYFRRPAIDAYLKFPVVINKNGDEVKRYFASLQIGVMSAVETPLHHLLGLPRMEYPNTERLYQKGIAIPIYPNLTANNVERICSSLRGIV